MKHNSIITTQREFEWDCSGIDWKSLIKSTFLAFEKNKIPMDNIVKIEIEPTIITTHHITLYQWGRNKDGKYKKGSIKVIFPARLAEQLKEAKNGTESK